MNTTQKIKQNETHSITANCITLTLATSTIFFSLTRPSECKAALLAGYEICTTQLLFALFPFLIAANLLIACNVAPFIGKPFHKLFLLFDFTEPCACGLFSIALLGGFAPAISALSHSVEDGQISKAQAARLLPTICFLGPSYTIVAVGMGMLGNLRVGVILFISQVGATIVVAFLLHAFRKLQQTTWHRSTRQANLCIAKCTQSTYNTTHDTDNTNEPRTPDFTISSEIADSFFAFLRLCGVILYFQFLAAGVCAFLPQQHQWLCQILLEVTAACASISNAGIHASFRCCAALSLLSASIILQAIALCPKDISIKPLLFARLFHLPISLMMFRFFLYIPQTQSVYNSLNERVLPMQRVAVDQAILLFIALIFLVERLRKPLQTR